MSTVILKRRKHYIVAETGEVNKSDKIILTGNRPKWISEVWTDNTYAFDENLKFVWRIPWDYKANRELFVIYNDEQIEHYKNNPTIYDVASLLNEFAKVYDLENVLSKHSSYLIKKFK